MAKPGAHVSEVSAYENCVCHVRIIADSCNGASPGLIDCAWKDLGMALEGGPGTLSVVS